MVPNTGSSIAGMPSLGGPPEMMSFRSMLNFEKSVFGHSERQKAGLACAGAAAARSTSTAKKEAAKAAIRSTLSALASLRAPIVKRGLATIGEILRHRAPLVNTKPVTLR